jgi:hypothetical protein
MNENQKSEGGLFSFLKSFILLLAVLAIVVFVAWLAFHSYAMSRYNNEVSTSFSQSDSSLPTTALCKDTRSLFVGGLGYDTWVDPASILISSNIPKERSKSLVVMRYLLFRYDGLHGVSYTDPVQWPDSKIFATFTARLNMPCPERKVSMITTNQGNDASMGILATTALADVSSVVFSYQLRDILSLAIIGIVAIVIVSLLHK